MRRDIFLSVLFSLLCGASLYGSDYPYLPDKVLKALGKAEADIGT